MEDYAQRNGFTNVRHFTDDGVSGTTFDREGFKAMIAEVEAGNVSTIIVKDSCVIIGPNQKGSKKLEFSGLVPSFLTERGQ